MIKLNSRMPTLFDLPIYRLELLVLWVKGYQGLVHPCLLT